MRNPNAAPGLKRIEAGTRALHESLDELCAYLEELAEHASQIKAETDETRWLLPYRRGPREEVS